MFRLSSIALILALWGCSAAPAPEPASPDEVAEAYIAAVNAGSLEALESLVHPDCIATRSTENEIYWDYVHRREVDRTIPVERSISIREITPDEDLPFASHFNYPVRPTREVTIEYDQLNDDGTVNEHSSASILRMLAPAGDGWAIVVPDPTFETLERMRKAEDRKHGR